MPTTAQQADDDTVRSRFMAFLRAEIAAKPSIYLSAGVSNAQFVESLRMATGAGTDFSGVLCGRATWKEGIPVYAKSGAKALEDWLSKEGVKNINAVNDAIKSATPRLVLPQELSRFRSESWAASAQSTPATRPAQRGG